MRLFFLVFFLFFFPARIESSYRLDQTSGTGLEITMPGGNGRIEFAKFRDPPGLMVLPGYYGLCLSRANKNVPPRNSRLSFRVVHENHDVKRVGFPLFTEERTNNGKRR